MRCLCVTLTSLPGPAPHCEALSGYDRPRGWHDVATRLGPLMGDFRTCGDLLFSGHTAWTTVSMLLLTKSFRRAPRLVYAFVKSAGFLYLLTMATCTIAGRKHYTVDVALAVVIAGLTFFRFQDGMLPRRHRPRPASGAPSPNGIGSNGGSINGGMGYGHQRHRPHSNAYVYHNLHQQRHGNSTGINGGSGGGSGSGSVRPHRQHKRKLTAEAAEDLMLPGPSCSNGGGGGVSGSGAGAVKRGGGGVGDATPPTLSASALAAAAAGDMRPSASSSSVTGLLTTATNRGVGGGGGGGDGDRGGGVGGLLAQEGRVFVRGGGGGDARGHSGGGGGSSGGSSSSGWRLDRGEGGAGGRRAGRVDCLGRCRGR
ncbi:unnamed protein product [Ectocarpus sp. 6 AP-2014]